MNFRAVIKKVIPKNFFAKVEPYGHWAEALIENIIFRFPFRGIKTIGITGTAGKTTTSTLLAHILKESGLNVGYMGTVSIDYADGRGPIHNETRMTSLGSLRLIKTVKQMRKNNMDWLVMEVSSQALTQHRVLGVTFQIVGYTNLSHDNYHYHGSFSNYRDAKIKLFKQANRRLLAKRAGVVNIDDENGKYFARNIKNPLTYGIKKGDLRASDIELNPNGSAFNVSISGDVYKIKSNLPGMFNVYNTLCAIGIAREVGLSIEQIEKGIASLKAVEGRMNSIDLGQDFGVIVDYACTPESFKQLFAAIKPLAKGRVISVFGSAGRRDEAKRPLQGKIAGNNSDIVILTEEDDRDQDGMKIIEEIAEGVKKTGKKKDKDLFYIHNREEAVEKAISLAKKDDLVLLLGKGEETVIITNKPGFKTGQGHIYNESTDTLFRHYNETETAKKVLKKIVKH